MDSSWRTAVSRDPALPDRLCHRRGARHGAGDLVGLGRRWPSIVLVDRPGLRLRLRAHHARRCSAPALRSRAALAVALAADTVVDHRDGDHGQPDRPGWSRARWPPACSTRCSGASLALSLAVAFVVTVPVNRCADRPRPGPRRGARLPPLTRRLCWRPPPTRREWLATANHSRRVSGVLRKPLTPGRRRGLGAGRGRSEAARLEGRLDSLLILQGVGVRTAISYVASVTAGHDRIPALHSTPRPQPHPRALGAGGAGSSWARRPVRSAPR